MYVYVIYIYIYIYVYIVGSVNLINKKINEYFLQ